jgi:hypothetical protein
VAAAEQVQVDVVDSLTAIVAGVDHDAEASGQVAFADVRRGL